MLNAKPMRVTLPEASFFVAARAVRFCERPGQKTVSVLGERVGVVVALVDVVLALFREAVRLAVFVRAEVDDHVGLHVVGDEAFIGVRELGERTRLDRAEGLLIELGVVALVQRCDRDALAVGVVEFLHHRVEGHLLGSAEGVPQRDTHRTRERDVRFRRLLSRGRLTAAGRHYQHEYR